MTRSLTLTLALSLCVLLAIQTHAESEAESGTSNKPGAPTISITKLNVTDTTLELYYQITNPSEWDIWLSDDIDVDYWCQFEVYLTEDGRTLLIRRRFDVPLSGYRNQPFGRYVRLRAGQSRTESVCLAVPVRPRYALEQPQQTHGLQCDATRLAIEMGYYVGDLPEMILDALQQSEEVSDESADNSLALIKENVNVDALLYFNEVNEGLRDRDEEFLITHTFPAVKGAQVLRITVGSLRIPYEEKHSRPVVSPPDLTGCTRVKIRYQPSMLDYFFPYPRQQALLSPQELEYLQSAKTVFVADRQRIKAFVHDVAAGLPGGIVTERSTAHVTCYRDGEHLTSFTIYDDTSIVTEEQQRLRYKSAIPSLKALTPQIQALELRVRCAANLRDLWYRLRLYDRPQKVRAVGLSKKTQMTYPVPTQWCNAILRAYRAIGMLDKNIVRPHICPSAGQGKCHYAMNPNCRPNSPPDTVLLFETKAGWNQHGGPKLFTFDNHDPAGGCVLLNDGSVKFIRTKEELRQLRWK